MSLELLFKTKKIENKPYLMFFYGILFSCLAIILSLRMFPGYASIVIITFTIIPLVPLMVKLIEDDESLYEHKKWILRHHFTFKAYSFLFLGLIISFSSWYFFLPTDISNHVFSEQIETLYELEGALATYSDDLAMEGCNEETFDQIRNLKKTNTIKYSCKSIDLNKDGKLDALIYLNNEKIPSIASINNELVQYKSYIRNKIIKNNISINLFIFVTSFIFGAGALFVLAWNASILGVFIGDAARKVISSYSLFGKVSAYFNGLNISFGKIILHGIPEFSGFFISAIAGGILSVAIIKHGFFDKRTKKVFKDSIILMTISISLIIFAAFIEVI